MLRAHGICVMNVNLVESINITLETFMAYVVKKLCKFILVLTAGVQFTGQHKPLKIPARSIHRTIAPLSHKVAKSWESA
jgi:hypothetical protein